MAETSCTPCEINELQAWKCMMDSMVRFIQASTKLMGAFNDKPYEDRTCHKDCKSYNPNKIPKCKKCLSTDFTDERENITDNCHEKCAICIPKQSSKCKCPAPLLSKGTTDTERSEPSFLPKEVGEDQTPDEHIEMSANATIPTEQTREDTIYGDIQQDTEQFTETVTSVANELLLDDTTESKAVYVDQSAYATEENLKPQWETKNKKDGKRGMTKRQAFEDATKCKCGYDIKEICSCPLSSAEKLELTQKMATKLQVAQDEIDELKKELYELQFTERNKDSKSAALYKEIMKGSALDQSFGRPGTAHITLRDQSRTLQRPTSGLKRLPIDKTQIADSTYQHIFPAQHQTQLPITYQAQQSYINYNYELLDDDSCNDEYNCSYDDCDKYRTTVLF
ncbi:uncharacterized protein LOC114345343 isoform X2 [Diabrotica virgifera virgifera]|uniref:TNFR-Cys domain-containing protein n=1 Tax=Diabrotica virgifera virgifera TaxID=50390 RepID=A0ABM5KP53_DIAVI|nr:uncharacterized protein LOC114345343 isoform X2 [Diabrotica virgifera virgifera]